jgi:hypothetical protein
MTVILSVVLSVLATFVVGRYQSHRTSDVVRAKKIELVDDHGHVRGAFELGEWDGKVVPSISLLDDQGAKAVLLQLNPRGEGTLYFSSSRVREGIVSLGYLQSDDTDAPEDPLGGWGLVVQDSETNRTSMGLKNSGKPFGLSTLTEKTQPAMKTHP